MPVEREILDAMATAKTKLKTDVGKRGQGRPMSGGNDVGRERLLIAAEKLLRTLPPARVTSSRIAEEANADPALVRYYFGDRTKLLMAVVDRITMRTPQRVEPAADPQLALADRIGVTVQFVRSVPFMHRLVVEELAQDGTDESRSRVGAMNLGLVDVYRRILDQDGGAEMIDADPLLLHLVVLGASDFFASAEPLVRQLMPEGVDMEKMTSDFQAFLIEVLMNGLRKR